MLRVRLRSELSLAQKRYAACYNAAAMVTSITNPAYRYAWSQMLQHYNEAVEISRILKKLNWVWVLTGWHK